MVTTQVPHWTTILFWLKKCLLLRSKTKTQLKALLSNIPLTYNLESFPPEAVAVITQLQQALLEKEKQVATLQRQLAQALDKIESLARRLNLDSTNSSKPPSSDGLQKKNRTLSMRTKTGRKTGGQPEHPGATLQQVAAPDAVEEHVPTACQACGKSLADIPAQGHQKRQVADLPAPQPPLFHEHRALIKQCSCGHSNVGDFPTNVTAPIQYGPRVRSLVAYLRIWQLLPIDRVTELVKDCMGVEISQGTIENMTAEFAQLSARQQQAALEELQKAPIKHLDETGVRINGKLCWLHVTSSGTQTHYRVREKRKDLLEDMSGIIVHDHWKPYFRYEDVEHGLCNAHHLRELKALVEHDQERWAASLSQLLKLVSSLVSKGEGVKDCLQQRIYELYSSILQRGLAYHESLPELSKRNKGRPKRRKGHNLVLRLLAHSDDVLRCLSNPQVPFSNNQAERDLRMVKVRQKISGCFRSVEGAEGFCIARGFLSTARKQGRNIIETIEQLYLPQQAAA